MSPNHRKQNRQVWESIFVDVPNDWFAAPPSPVMFRCADFLRQRGARAVLDLGCGIGRWSVFLARQGLGGTVGVDYAVGGVRTALRWSRREAQPTGYACADTTRLPFRGGVFDAVVAALVFEGLSRADMARSMTELARVTVPEAAGFFVFNPHFSENELAELEQSDNPTRDCTMESYGDSEIEQALSGWQIRRFETREHRLRLVEAVRGEC